MPDKDNPLLNVPGTYNFPQGVQPTQYQQNGGGNYLNAFLEQVKKTTPASDGLTYIPAAAVDNTGRFPSVLPGVDSEEAYAQGQSWYSKAGHGIGKGLGIAGTTLVQGTIGMVNGVGKWAETGKFSSLYDNDLNRSLDQMNKDLENSLPNYYTQAETNADWYSPKNLLTANFIFDKLIKNTGYAVGAIGSGMAWGGALRAIGLTGKLMQAGAAMDAASLDAAKQALLNAPKAEKLSTWINSLKEMSTKGAGSLLKQSDRIITSTLATSGEASMEALQGLNEYRSGLIADYKKKYGVEPIGDDLAKINESAEKVGNTTFALNTALLSATNYIQFPKIIGSTFKGEKALVNQELGSIVRDAEGGFMADIPTTRFGKIISGAKGVGKLLFSTSEAFEEGSQSAIQAGVQNYYKKGYEGKDSSFIDDALGFGVHKALTTKDGLESILLGGLTGGLMEARSTVKEQGFLGNSGEKAIHTQEAVDTLNGTKRFTSYLKDQAASVQRGEILQQERMDAIRKGDVLESKDLETDYLHNYLSTRIKYGKLDSVLQDVNEYKTLASTQEGFEKLQAEGIATPEDTKDSFALRLSNIEQQANLVRDAYRTISNKYSGYVNKTTGERIYSDDTIDKMVYASAKINDYTRRLSEISGEIAQKFPDAIAYSEAITQATEWGKSRNSIREEQMHSAIQDVIYGIDKLNIPEAEKEDLVSNFNDAIEMVVRKQAYMQEYNDIKNNPIASESTTDTNDKFSVDGKEYLSNRDYEGPEYTYKAEKVANEEKWVVKSSKGKMLGTFDSKEQADKVAEGFTSFRGKSPSVKVLYKVGNQIAVRDASGKRFFVDAALLENHSLVKTQEEVINEDKTIQDEIVKLGEDLNKEASDVPTGEYSVDVQQMAADEDASALKSILTAQASSTAPNPNQTAGDYNRAQRETAFHEMLVKNPALRDSVRILAITYNNQKQYGFDFIKPTYQRVQNGKAEDIDNAKDVEQGSIALVYVKEIGEGLYTTLDHKGSQVGTVDASNIGANDPNRIVFTFLENSDVTRYSKEKGVDTTKFHINKSKEKGVKTPYTQEEVESILAQGKKFRTELFNYSESDPKIFKFTTSKGFANEEKGEPASVVETGLISQDELSHRVFIDIPTVKQEGGNMGFISVGGEVFNIPVGRPVFNRESDFVPLRNTKISKEQANNVFSALEYAASELFKGNKIPKSVLSYISNIAYTRKGGSVFIAGNELVFGGSLKVPLTSTALQADKADIINYLQTLYHNVNNKTLQSNKAKPEAFYEFTGVEDDKPSYRIWKSYQHYLLSPINDLVDENSKEHGSKRISPLSVNIKVDKKYSESGITEPPMKGKYVILKDYFEYVPVVKKEEKAKAPQPMPKSAAPIVITAPNFSLPESNEFNTTEYTIPGSNTLSSKDGASIVFTVDNTGQVIINPSTTYSTSIANEKDATETVLASFNQLQPIVAKKEEALSAIDKQIFDAVLTNDNYNSWSNVRDKSDFDDFKAQVKSAINAFDNVSDKSKITSENVDTQLSTAKPFQNKTIREAITPLILSKYGATYTTTEEEAIPWQGDEFDGYKRVGFEEAVDKTWDEPSFRAYMAEKLPMFNINRLKNVIKTTDGGYAWGAQRAKYIYLYEGAPAGTEYHEAFEGVWNSFLTPREQKLIIANFNKRQGSFINAETGESIKYSEATAAQVKEEVADEFGRFRTTGEIFKGEIHKMGFFRQLWDFIKAIFTTPELDIQKLFSRIDSAYYRNADFTGNSTSTAYSKIRKQGKISEGWLNDVMHQMSFRLRATMQKSGKLVDLAEGRVSIQEAYDTLYGSMDNFYRQVAHPSSPFTDEQREQLIRGKDGFKGWGFIKDNWQDFVAENMLFNQSLGMSFPKGEYSFDAASAIEQFNQQEAEDSTTTEETQVAKEENRNRNEYDRDITMIDSWANSSKAVKLLFNTLTEHNYPRANNTSLDTPIPTISSVGDRRFVEGNKLFYIVQNELVGSKDNNERQERFRRLATKNPNLVSLYKALYTTDPANRTDADWKIIVQFNNTMSLQCPEVVMQYRDETGETRMISSDTSSVRDKVVETWAENIKTLYKEDGSGLVVRNTEDNTYSIDTRRIKNAVSDKDSAIKFLDEIKFGFSKTLYNRLDESEQNDFLRESKKIYELFKQEQYIATTKIANVNGPLKALATLKAIAEGDNSSGSFSDASGNMRQSNILPNHLSKTNDAINGTTSRTNLLANNPWFNNPYTANSLLLNTNSWKNGKRVSALNTVYVDATKDAENNTTELSKANLAQRLLIERNSNLRGIYYALVGADAKTEWGITFRDSANMPSHFITFNDYEHDGAWQEKLHGIFQGYLKDEIALIRQYNSGVGTDNAALSKEDANGMAAGQKLRFFKAVFSAINDNKELGYSGGEKLRILITDWANGKGEGTLDELLEANADQINLAVDAYMLNMTKRQTAFMKREELIIGTDGAMSIEGIDTDMLDKLDLKNGKLSESDINRIIAFTTMNYVIANTELHKVYYGDPAQYKDSIKRIKSFQSGRSAMYVNDSSFNARMSEIYNNGLSSETPGYIKFAEEYVTLTVDHGDSSNTQIVSERYTTIYNAALRQAEADGYRGEQAKAKADKIASAYTEVNEADAQAYRISTSVIEQSIRTGDASEAQKAFFKWDAAYTRNAFDKKGVWEYGDNKELKAADDALLATPKPKAIFNVRKPITSGVIERDGMMEAHLYKNSEMPLFYSTLPEGSVLQDMYEFMWTNNIDAIGPESQHKVGSPTRLPKLYDVATGKLNTQELEDSSAFRFIPWNINGKQVETAGEHNGQTIITQLQAIYQQDMFNSGIPTDTTWDHEEWSNLTEEEKKDSSDIYSLSQQNAAMRAELSAIGYNNLLNKLGIKEEEGDFVSVDGQKLSAFLKQELTRREVDANTLDAIEAIYNPVTDQYELGTPLEALNKYAVIKQMIWAVADREIVHTKLNGGQKIQISGAMWENAVLGRERMYKKDGVWTKVQADSILSDEEKKSIRLTSSHYKFYDLKEGDKKISAMEVGLPCHFRDKIKQSKKLRNMSDSELLAYLNTAEGRDILTGVGARIPVQGMNSVEVFIVKEFLPEELGDAIVVPSEITTKSGSDFDVDKLNTYLKNVYVDAEGDLKVVPYYGVGQEAIDKFKKLVDEFESREDLLSSLLNVNLKATRNEDAIENFDFEAEEAKIEDKAIALYRQSIENEYFRTMEDMITLPSNFLRLMTPNSAQELKDIAADVKKSIAKGRGNKEELINTVKGDINYGTLFNPMEMAKTRNIFMITKDGVGIAASNVKLFTLLQAGNIRMEESLKFPHNSLNEDGKSYISFSNTKDVDGNYISEQNSQSVDGVVDVAKDPYYPDLLGFGDLLSPAMVMRGAGVSKNMTYYFLRQPIVQDFMYEKAKDKQKSALNSAYTSRSQKAIKSALVTRWGNGSPATINQFQLLELKEAIENPQQEGRNTIQLAVLDEFLKVIEISDKIFKLSEGLKWDTAKFRSGSWVDIKESQWNEANKQDILGIEELMATNYIGGIRTQVLNTQQSLIPIFNMEQEHIRDVLEPIQTRIIGMYTGTDTKVALMQKAELSLLNYVMLTEGKLGGKPINEYFYQILIGDGNISNRLSALLAEVSKHENSDLANNPALLALSSVRRNNVQATKNVALINKPSGAYEQNTITNAFRELKDNPISSDFYRAFVLAGMLQSGLINSRISYNSLIPNESYGAIMKGVIDIMDNMSEDSLMEFSRLNVFERSNWNNELIVPKAKKWKYSLDNRLTSISKNANSFITLPRTDSPIPVVKISQIAINPNTGLEYSTVERKKMAQNGNFSFLTNRIYQYVTDMSTVQDTKRGAGAATVAVYKQINAWGDGQYAQEMYNTGRPSVLATNEKVDEVDTKSIIQAVTTRPTYEVVKSDSITLKDGNTYTADDLSSDMLEAMNYSPEEIGDILEKLCK